MNQNGIVDGELDAAAGFFWPTPPYAMYSAAQPFSEPQGCDLEGVNGNIRPCRLLSITPSEQMVQIQMGNVKTPVPLAFAKFRKITLKTPIHPQEIADSAVLADLAAFRPTVQYLLHLENGSTLSGVTVGYVETPFGLFLFTPIDEKGTVERVFIPRTAFLSASFGDHIGQVIGQVLVEQQLVTPQQVELALDTQQSLRDRKIGDYLMEHAVVSPEQLMVALDQQLKMPMILVGDALIRLGYISENQLLKALERQKTERSVPLGELLVQMGFVTREDLNIALARKMGYPMVDVARFPIEPEALRKIPFATAQRLMVLPLLLRPGLMVVATVDPTSRKMIEELEFLLQTRVVTTLGDKVLIQSAQLASYEKLGISDVPVADEMPESPRTDRHDPTSSIQLLESMELHENDGYEDSDEDGKQITQSDNTLVRLINTMIVEAYVRGVSDIHVESQPRRAKVRIRFRQDGVLTRYLELPHSYRSAVVARLKIMANLDISERRRPQDGKIDFGKFSARHRLELRVATIPTTNGLEDVVLRLLSSAKPIAMEKLDLTESNLQLLRDAVSRPYGMVLCVGPTGSGKTSSLHSILSFLNTFERKIWTAEDPVEITQPGLRQVQVNPAIGWTFAKALRAFLRADPDIIMVGEIRDAETATMAIEASLTGHLLLSTLHTNSSVETVTRLIDMGMNPFNFADSLLAVLAQRLVRRLCRHCSSSEVATRDWVAELLDDYLFAFPDALRPERNKVLSQWQNQYGHGGGIKRTFSAGCSQCHGRGFSGRLVLHELMCNTPGLRRLIQIGASPELLQAEAFRMNKFRTLRQDGILKVLQGHTTIEEVRAYSNG